YISEDLGSKTCLHGWFWNPATFTSIDPADGDTYAIYTLTQWDIGSAGAYVGGNAGLFIQFQDIEITGSGILQLTAGAELLFVNCKFSCFAVDMYGATPFLEHEGCLFTCPCRSFAGGGAVYLQNTVHEGAGCGPRVENGGRLQCDRLLCHGGAYYRGGAQGDLIISSPCAVSNSAQNAVNCYGLGIVRFASSSASVFGADRFTGPYVVNIEGSGTVLYDATAGLPDVTGFSTAYANVGGTTKTLANMQSSGFVNTTKNAAFVTL